MAVPAAPSITGITPGDNTLSVAFTSVTSDPVVTDNQYQIDGKGGWQSIGVASPFVISGLANGRAYSVKIRSVNADGNSPASAASNGTPVDSNAANDNGFDDASWAANPGAPVGNLDYADPDD